MPQGTLQVTLVAARELTNKDTLVGKNDPFAIIKLGGQKFTTEVRENAGSECQWNQTFQFGVTEEMNDLTLEVYDKDKVIHDLIGKTTIPLMSIFQNGFADAWYTIGKGAKSHGEVHVQFRFIPGPFPAGFDPKAIKTQENLKLAGKIVGGAVAVGAIGIGAKLLYDHLNKKEDTSELEGLNQEQQDGQRGYDSQQQGYENNQYDNQQGYGKQQDSQQQYGNSQQSNGNQPGYGQGNY